jgi:hypothetical protein
MGLTQEGLVVAAFVLVPGFVYYSVSRSFQPPQATRPSEVEVLLRSLALTLLLVGAEAVVLLAVLAFAPPVREDVEFLLRNGVNDYVDRNALALPYTLASLGLINIVVMMTAGWFELPERLVRRAQHQRGLSAWNAWYLILRNGPADSGERRRAARLPLGVRVRLKKGGLYHGVLAVFSLSRNPGDRDLALWNVYYSPTGQPADLTEINPDGKSAVIVAASEIESIEVFYPNVSSPPTAGR